MTIGRSVAKRYLGVPPWRAMCLVVAVGLCMALAPRALASAPSYVWSGRSTVSENWSFAANWEGEVVPSKPGIGTLTFPRLTSTACTLEPEFHPCYISFNDVNGLSAESLEIDDGDTYLIGGEGLALGNGGLTASPASASHGFAADFLEMPFQLTSSQKWTVANRSGGGLEEDAMFLGGSLTGSGSSLSFEQSNGSALFLDNETNVGPVTLEGANASGQHIANGAAILAGELNATDGEPVTLRHIFFAGVGSVGPLATEAATVDVGSDTLPAETLEAAHVELDSASGLLFEVTGSGAVPGVDYSQLRSHGSIQLGGAALVVIDHPTEKGRPCPTLTHGERMTLMSTTGTLSGTFAGIPEGGPEVPISFAESCPRSQTMRISYNRSGPVETVTATVEAQAKEREEAEAKHEREREEEIRKHEREHEEEVKEREREEEVRRQEEARKKQEEEAVAAAAARRHSEEEALAATAKRRAEEEAARGGVLGVQEGAPIAAISESSSRVAPSGVFRIKVTCPKDVSDCTGTVTLRTIGAVVAGSGSDAMRKASVLTLATGSFTVHGGGVGTVTLHLSSKARALLARLHLLRARATIVARDPAGATHRGQAILTLRMAKRGRA